MVPVVVADGTGLSMPDTGANQQVRPQARTQQRRAAAFRAASLCACFCLQTGAVLSYEVGNKHSHELPLLRKQWKTFNAGDIFLGDKGCCSYYDVWHLQKRGVASVIPLARRWPVPETKAIKVLGDNDRLIEWTKPVRSQTSSYSQPEWEALPATLRLRQIKVTVTPPGFRVTTFYLITTLLDAAAYPASELADLYLQRWQR